MVQPLRPTRKPNHKKYVHLSNVSDLSIKTQRTHHQELDRPKEKHNQAVKNEEMFYFLDVMFNITLWNVQKFPEIVQRIYNAIFVSIYKYSPYFIDKQNVIPVCVKPKGLDYNREKT